MYRKRAAEGRLREIAPRRFNPIGEAWLPIMHAFHGGWHFTALYSNSRLAHELKKTADCVVIHYQRDGAPEGRVTVVTRTRGPMAGNASYVGAKTTNRTENRNETRYWVEDDQARELAIPLETVCFIIMKARQFDAKEAATEPDPSSNPTDDENAAILQDQPDDPVQEEPTSLISDLSDDEQIDLVTLMWLGRDDYGSGD